MSPAPTMQALVEAYLAARRSMGFDLRIAGSQLLAFARFADQTGHRGPLTVALAVRWAQSARRATRLTWARRLQVLRPFMKYRVQFETGTEIVPSNLFGPDHRRLVPHLYTEAEIGALLDAAAQLWPVTGLRLRPRTYSTLFGLLASTGLRISEALALTLTDVDLPGESLTVRETKFRKSLGAAASHHSGGLEPIRTCRRRRVSDRRIETFFVSDQGTPLGDRIVHHTFARLRAQLGWIGRGDYALPRVHDLRRRTRCLMKTASSDASLAALLQAFFLERLIAQRNASPQTVAAYRDSFRLLLQCAQRHVGKAPERLELNDVEAPLVLAFLDHLERDRHNTIRSRNVRLAAIRSFVHFAAFKDPAALPGIQRVLAIPMKRFDKPLLGFLSKGEIQAILDAPPDDRWSGQPDRIMFATLYNTGARVSEVTGFRVAQVDQDPVDHATDLDRCCHSRLLRANRDTSRAATPPTFPRQTSATMRSNPARVTVPAAERPKSSSTTSISRQPSGAGGPASHTATAGFRDCD